MLALLASISLPADAGSLDLIEVGGAWGTPAATNPSAVWWNPAGLAVKGGHQLMIDVAPTFGRVTAQRDNPDYGDLDPTFFGDGYPDSYDYGGTDELSFAGAVPFIGVSSDLTVPGLGVGLALAVPTGKGGGIEDPTGPNRYALIDGDLRFVYTMLGASYQVADVVSFGLSGALVNSSYVVETDASVYADIADGVADELRLTEIPPEFQDGYAELPEYATNSIFDLKDTAFTFGAGVYLTPVQDKLGISLAYTHGVRLENTGELTLAFQCPPEYDVNGRAAAETLGICNASTTGEGTIAFRLPSRVNLGVAAMPVERLRLELMGSYVFWSVFQDYEINTSVAPSEFSGAVNAVASQEASLLASQDRLWARDSKNALWVGLDGKVQAHDVLTLGARVTYDQSAIPDEAISANNYDADTVLLSGLVDVTPAKPVSIGVSFTHSFLAQRVVTDSPFRVGADLNAVEPRYFYPSANGTYTGSINRLGITLRGRLGGD